VTGRCAAGECEEQQPGIPAKPPADLDADPQDTSFYEIATIEGIVQQVIRKARPTDRSPMWRAFQDRLAQAAQDGPDVMPWEAPETVTSISCRSASGALKAMIWTVTDPAERKRLAAIIVTEAEELESMMEAGTAGSGIPVSALRCQVCSKPLPAGSRSTRRTCSDACRQAAARSRRRSRQGPATV
jgi:hypothetical protein